jgi:hypothetical protein
LLQACTILYKKGIRTTTSSANHKNDFPKGNITIGIDESTLSNENKQIIFSIPEKFHPSVKINIT